MDFVVAPALADYRCGRRRVDALTLDPPTENLLPRKVGLWYYYIDVIILTAVSTYSVLVSWVDIP
jgi:hypothetical protein